MKNGLLSKLTTLAIAGVLAFSAAACGNTGGTTTAAPGTTAAPTTQAGTTAAPTTTEAPPEEAKADVPADRYDATATPRTGKNDTAPLVLQTGTLDGKFSPFFATSAYDVDVTGMTGLGLLFYDKDGAPQAGVDLPSLAYSFDQEVNADNTESKYTFVLKNGITFSDGQPVTVKDVLFSIYVLSDPYYDGSSTYYTMAIEGMGEYRLQTSTEMIEVAKDIVEAGISGEAGADPVYGTPKVATAEQQAAFWGYMDEAGEKFAQEIIDYVNGNYRNEDYVGMIFGEGVTPDQVAADTTLQNIFGMARWGYGEVVDGVFTDANGDTFTIGTDTVDAKVYWNNILGAYGYNLSEDNGINLEKAGDLNIEDYVNDLYIANEGQVEGGVENISGITTSKVTGDDGVERDAIEIVVNGVDPTAIFKMGITVSPMHYYTEGFSGELNDNGVATKDQAFMDHLKTKNQKPVGAGPYVFENYENNVVTYSANDSFLLGSPKIKTVRYQEVAGGSEMDVLKTGAVHYSNPSASTELVNNISAGEGDFAGLDYILVDNDGYGYIGIQGQVFPELEVRQALAHAMNVQLAVDDYYGELASPNYRTMTKVLWAYPESTEPLYAYDATGETSKALFLKAGYVYDETAKTMSYPEAHEKAGQQVTIKMTLPSNAADHPAGSILIDTQKVLESIGVKTEIEVDQNLLNKLSTAYESGVQIWAAAWGGGGVDPDMFQIWYSDPAENQGTSAARSGLYYLYANGSDEQKAMLVKLNELIKAGRSTLDQEERKQIYAEALELSTGLAVEVPTYQRKNMFAFDKEVINASTMFTGDDVTPFQSPISWIWNVELNG
ncbi:MAG: hypothetical protein EOM03_03660 [Clostridia bacterium]|nr:hypothetical protein [Clostridia bacterium]